MHKLFINLCTSTLRITLTNWVLQVIRNDSHLNIIYKFFVWLSAYHRGWYCGWLLCGGFLYPPLCSPTEPLPRPKKGNDLLDSDLSWKLWELAWGFFCFTATLEVALLASVKSFTDLPSSVQNNRPFSTRFWSLQSSLYSVFMSPLNKVLLLRSIQFIWSITYFYFYIW